MSDLIANTPTMTTREIAVLVEKRHDNVLRGAEADLQAIEIQSHLKFEASYRDASGRSCRELRLPKREVLILTAGHAI